MSAPADAPTPDATDAKPAGRSVPLPLILAVLVGLGVGVGAGLFAVGPALAKGIAPAVAANAAHGKKAKAAAGEHGEEGADGESADHEGDGEEEEEGEGGEEAKGDHGKEGAAGAPVYTLDNLVLNPAESGGTRFLLLSIAFEAKNQEAHDALKARDAELRDLVLATLGSKTVEQLTDVTGRDSLKIELGTAASKLLKKKKVVKRVYFPQFVIQ